MIITHWSSNNTVFRPLGPPWAMASHCACCRSRGLGAHTKSARVSLGVCPCAESHEEWQEGRGQPQVNMLEWCVGRSDRRKFEWPRNRISPICLNTSSIITIIIIILIPAIGLHSSFTKHCHRESLKSVSFTKLQPSQCLYRSAFHCYNETPEETPKEERFTKPGLFWWFCLLQTAVMQGRQKIT